MIGHLPRWSISPWIKRKWMGVVRFAAAAITGALNSMVAELPKNADLEMAMTNLFFELQPSHPEVKKFIMGMAAARRALVELGITL
jgi:hypothetical protein